MRRARHAYDAVVVGSGPNGLAAAITLARQGFSVLVLEAQAKPGGAVSSDELTLPGFHHDVGSAVYPFAFSSPFLLSLPLEKFGLRWIVPDTAAAHPLGNGEVVFLENSVDATASGLGADDARYRRLFAPLARRGEELIAELLGPPLHWPRHPAQLARFAPALLSASRAARILFRGPRARALFAGMAAHANAPLERGGTAAIAMMLQLAAHTRGWALPRGGAGNLAAAMVAYFLSLGGELRTGERVKTIAELPARRWTFLDLTPRQVRDLLNEQIYPSARARLGRFRYGPGVFKLDWALSGPVPWEQPNMRRAATVHLGGSFEEIESSERRPSRGEMPENPFMLFVQPSLFDDSRAPAGRHTAWAYCHLPHASAFEATALMEAQVERYAPGFRALILGRSRLGPASLEAKNANLVGGDIGGGEISYAQLFLRPRWSLDPYALPLPGYFLCSSSAPPGPGVHGMCGYQAALRALGTRA